MAVTVPSGQHLQCEQLGTVICTMPAYCPIVVRGNDEAPVAAGVDGPYFSVGRIPAPSSNTLGVERLQLEGRAEKKALRAGFNRETSRKFVFCKLNLGIPKSDAWAIAPPSDGQSVTLRRKGCCVVPRRGRKRERACVETKVCTEVHDRPVRGYL